MLTFETPQERIQQRQKVNILLLGASGSGKTFAARTLDPEKTLFIDGEAGTLSLGGWLGTVLNIRQQSQQLGVHPWELCRAVACLLAGADPQASAGTPYAKDSHDRYEQLLGKGIFDQYENVFVDSATVASRWSFDWSKKQPESFSEKTGKQDIRGAYGLHGREMIEWATQLQHQPKNIILSCILDEKEDDFSRRYYAPQIVGQKAGNELPGIFDVVLTIAKFPNGDEKHDKDVPRYFVTQHTNKYGYPAKDRSHVLGDVEYPDLGALITKIKTGNSQF